MDLIAILLVLIPGLPLAAALATAWLGKPVLGKHSHLPVVGALGLAFLGSVVLLVHVQYVRLSSLPQPTEQGGTIEAYEGQAAKPDVHQGTAGYERIVTLWTWAAVRGAAQSAGDFTVRIALRADPLTAIMLTVVTLVSLLVAVYSIGYMHDDPGYSRFFTYIALFVFSMTMLVSVSNFVLLYVFWEAVGLCSYLLIGFWFHKPEAAAAGKKAFLVNRVGDFGFALGVFLIWTTYGTLDFHDTAAGPGVLGQTRLADPHGYVGGATATAIALLLMLGACGKSAQFPLHVWLPDAMEGPTPVSALIHAATMVTAGVYMVTRCTPLYAASPDAVLVVAGIGGLTALMAAIIAVTQTDLKRILAYSTISQLGYMFLGLGAGTLAGISAGMFHLVTHAFFKALLFLAAGSVMHAMGGVIDVRRLGGLRRRLPTTHATFLVGGLALAGFPLLSGFFSKDEILAAVHHAAQGGSVWYAVLFVLGLVTALLTAFYTFRAYFLVFWGEERIPHEAGHHAHESPPAMTGPLKVLAVFSLLAGGVLWLAGGLQPALARTPSLAYLAEHHESPVAETGGHAMLGVVSGAVALAGIGLAWSLYAGPTFRLQRWTAAMNALGLYRLSAGKFFLDPAYNMLIVWPLEGVGRLSAWADRVIVDGLVNFIGRLPARIGAVLRWMQSGLIQFYALAMLLGVLLLLGALLM